MTTVLPQRDPAKAPLCPGLGTMKEPPPGGPTRCTIAIEAAAVAPAPVALVLLLLAAYEADDEEEEEAGAPPPPTCLLLLLLLLVSPFSVIFLGL